MICYSSKDQYGFDSNLLTRKTSYSAEGWTTLLTLQLHLPINISRSEKANNAINGVKRQKILTEITALLQDSS